MRQLKVSDNDNLLIVENEPVAHGFKVSEKGRKAKKVKGAHTVSGAQDRMLGW